MQIARQRFRFGDIMTQPLARRLRWQWVLRRRHTSCRCGTGNAVGCFRPHRSGNVSNSLATTGRATATLLRSRGATPINYDRTVCTWTTGRVPVLSVALRLRRSVALPVAARQTADSYSRLCRVRKMS